mgnify:CR=1 FL=1
MLIRFERICPLCGQDHPPRLFVYVKRTYRDRDKDKREGGESESTIVEIWVPRLWCQHNYDKRKSGPEKPQYTTTILPGFLIPYSRTPVDPVHEALEGHLGGLQLSQEESLGPLCCTSVASFRLFYYRAVERIQTWIQLLGEMVIQIGGVIEEAQIDSPAASMKKPLEKQWFWFKRLAMEWLRLSAQLPGSPAVPQRLAWQYVYALLSQRKTGLGP